MAKLAAARDCWAKVKRCAAGDHALLRVGYDAFWLARFLRARGIECLVIDPVASRSTGARDELRPIESTSRCCYER